MRLAKESGIVPASKVVATQVNRLDDDTDDDIITRKAVPVCLTKDQLVPPAVIVFFFPIGSISGVVELHKSVEVIPRSHKMLRC